ncbi:MAG: FAD-binding oxidoreductase [Myxococcota bacterium]|nr:FAD-binding oxidoreductase [Myxococcota bacterium]
MTGTDVIIVGGGVAGLSTAYQLSQRGVSVTLVERQQLGAGSTGQAAGLLGQVRKTASATRILVDGLKVVRELEAQTGQEIFVETGSLRLATTEARVEDTRNHVDLGAGSGLEVSLLATEETARLLPYMKSDDVILASHTASDGHILPHELTMSYAQIARKNGVKILQHRPVRDVIVEKSRARGVQTDQGPIYADQVVLACGPWAYLMAERVGQVLQTVGIEHVYLTTHPNGDYPIDRTSPAVRDYDGRIYSRPEAGGLIVGIYEDGPVLRDMAELDDDFEMSQMRAARDSPAVAHLLDSALHRFPFLENVKYSITQGIMTFTPNGSPLSGTIPGVDNLYHTAGFCGHGIVQSPAMGVIMAQLILNEPCTYDLSAIAADRYFGVPGFQERSDIDPKCAHTYSGHYGSAPR